MKNKDADSIRIVDVSWRPTAIRIEGQQEAVREMVRCEGRAAVLRTAIIEGHKVAAAPNYDGDIDAIDEAIAEHGGDTYLGYDLRDIAFGACDKAIAHRELESQQRQDYHS